MRKRNFKPTRATGTLFVSLVIMVLAIAKTAVADLDMAKEHRPNSWQSDAELKDVFFLDSKRGWTVGAQGVIRRTTDGGRTWNEISHLAAPKIRQLPLDQKLRSMRRLPSSSGVPANRVSSNDPVTCQFDSVYFVDEKHGWVAGGYNVPYVDRSRAVIMRTQDGGLTWDPVDNLVLPRLSRIKFFNRSQGWAVGETGNIFSGGMYTTSDGGISWSSQSSKQKHNWHDADRTENHWVTINQAGQLGTVKDNRYQPAVLLGLKHPIRATKVRMLGGSSTEGWAVGQGGLVLKTTNGGQAWKSVSLPEIQSQIESIDLTAISITENKVWIAGDSGTMVFCIDLKTGKSTAFPTSIYTRINQLHFVDDQTGWAVGALGIVIATTDGGQTWEVQRGENRRVAMLCVAASPTTLPLELLSLYSIEENRICASMFLGFDTDQKKRAAQATQRLGSVVSYNIPLPRQEITRLSDRDQALEKMVRAIRTLQPDIIVCNTGYDSLTLNPIGSINPSELVRNAVEMAANRIKFPNQIKQSGLKPWQVRRLVQRDASGTVTLDPSRMLPRAGALIEDQIALSRALMGQSVLSSDKPIYRVTELTSHGRLQGSKLFSGLGAPHQIPTRTGKGFQRGNLTMIRQTSAKQKTFKRFAQFEAKTQQDLQLWVQQVQTLALNMDQDVAGVWLLQLTERYLELGKTALAARSANLLVTRWPDHAFAPAALTWLTQYYGSAEFGQTEFADQLDSQQLNPTGSSNSTASDNAFATAPKLVHANGDATLVWEPSHLPSNASSNRSSVQLANFTSPDLARVRFDADRQKAAIRLLSQLSSRDPDLAAQPQYQLLESQLSRGLANLRLANEGRLKKLATLHSPGDADVAIGARRELALIDTNEQAKKSDADLICQRTHQRPNLDGKLTEPFWQSAIDAGNMITGTPNRAAFQAGASHDIAVLAYDDEFLYAGFRCRKFSGQLTSIQKQARPRDADLSRRDRIELELDIDQDFRSSFQFVVDNRGWVRESCAGSLGWNPDWYVSQSEDQYFWTIELAIPLKHLVADEIENGTTWAFQIARRGLGGRNIWTPDNEPSLTDTLGIRHTLKSRPSQFKLMRFAAANEESLP